MLRSISSNECRFLKIFHCASVIAIACAISTIATVGFCAPTPNTSGYVWRNVVTGGGGGFVDGIIFHPKQKDLIYCRTDIGGVYRWNPATSLWVPLTDWVGQENGNLRGAESIAVDPSDPNRVYVAAGTYMQPQHKTAILCSDDQGRTWKQTPMPGVEMGGNTDGRNIGERLAVDPHKGSIIYFGSREAGLWRSYDYGASFTKVTSFPDVPIDQPNLSPGYHPPQHAGIGWVVFDPTSGSTGNATQVIYAGVAATEMPSQVYRSADSGMTWAAVPGQPTGMIPQHAAFDKSGTLYVDYSVGLGPNGVSGGAVWKYEPSTGNWTDISPEKALGLHQTGGYGGLAVDYDLPGIVSVATLDHWDPADDVYRTLDGGKTWVSVESSANMVPTGAPWLNWGKPKPKFGWWIAALAIDPFQHKRVLFGTGATIWGTEDIAPAENGNSTTWNCYGNGIEETAVTALCCPPAGPLLISGLGDIGGFVHNDLTTTPPTGFYVNPVFGSTSSVDFAGQAPNLIVRAGANGDNQYGAISTDSGATWNPFPNLPSGANGGGSIALTADGKAILWRPQSAPVSYSMDNGQTWTSSAGISNTNSAGDDDYFGQGRVSIFTDRVDPNVVYVTGVSGIPLEISHDSGRSFAQDSATGLPSDDVSLIPSFAKAHEVFALAGGALYHSTDAGASFTRIVPAGSVDGFALGKAAPGKSVPAEYLVGTPVGAPIHGVYRSDDGGVSWIRINDDQHQYGWIGRPIAADLRVYGRVFVGTNGRGIVYGEPAGIN